MPRVRFTVPQVKSHPDTRPSSCPHCGSSYLHRHGSVTKPITDLHVSEVTVHRYRCCDCKRTFRHYPDGVDRHNQSLRLRGLAALSWALGLSHRSVGHMLCALGCELSRMSSWRDVQELGSGALRWVSRTRGRVRVIGADETVLKLRGEKTVVGVVTDAATGQIVGMDVLVERDTEGFVDWLSDYVSELGVEAMVTDDLSTYKPVVEHLGVEHQVCIAHVRKNVWNRLKKVDGWEWCKARIWELMTELPDVGGRELFDMERRVRGEPDLRRLVVELSEKWRSLTCHRRVSGMPQTNNCTERAIGRSKIRYKTVRGYESEEGMLKGLGLTQWVWSGEDGLDLGELIAA